MGVRCRANVPIVVFCCVLRRIRSEGDVSSNDSCVLKGSRDAGPNPTSLMLASPPAFIRCLSSATMLPYVYQPLDFEREEIRVLTLHPGTRDDGIRISISHVPFRPQPELAASITATAWAEAQTKLPRGWAAYKTLEGNIIFYHYHYGGILNRDKAYCSWRHPDNTFEQLRSKAVHLGTPSTSSVNFEALSYVWGSVDQRVDITVVSDSSPSSQTFLRLTPNLHLALVHLRRPKEPRLLWIDAICINREDPVEKSLQIQRMHVIYKHGTTPDPLIVRWSISDSRSNSLTA
jgi:hypothetical protein